MIKIVLAVLAALAGLVFLGLGVIALIGGIQQKRRCTESVPGVVSNVLVEEKTRGNRRFTTYTPEFEYRANGHTYTLRSGFSSMKREYREGEAVTISFDPADPAYACLANDTDSMRGVITLLYIGVALIVAMVVLLR